MSSKASPPIPSPASSSSGGHIIPGIALAGPALLFGSIVALDVIYLETQASWAAQLAFWLLPVTCILSLVVMLLTWLIAAQSLDAPTPTLPFAQLWHTPLAEITTLIFALSWWFRRNTPDAPSGIALGLALIGLGLLIWAATRRQPAPHRHS